MGSGCSKINTMNNNNNNEKTVVSIVPSCIIIQNDDCNNDLFYNYICDIKNLKVFGDNELINIQNMSDQEKMLIINKYNLMFEYINCVSTSSKFDL